MYLHGTWSYDRIELENRFIESRFKRNVMGARFGGALSTLSLQQVYFLPSKPALEYILRNTVLISRSLSNLSLKNITFSTLRKRNSSSKVPVLLSIPYVIESTSHSEGLTTLTFSNFFLLRYLESFRYFFSSFKRSNCVFEWNCS